MFLDFVGICVGSHPSENQRQEHQPVKKTEQDDEKLHSEVVKLEKSGWRKCENDNTDELGRCDTYQNRATHLLEGFLSSGFSITRLSHEIHANVVTELDTEAQTCHQIDDKHRIHFYWVGTEDFIEHPHCANKLEEHQENTSSNDDCNA